MNLNYFEDDKIAQEFVNSYLKMEDQQTKLNQIKEVTEVTLKSTTYHDSYFARALIAIKGILNG